MTPILAPEDLFSLEGTVAVVTGGSSGIGLATAGALASSGARTILSGMPEHHPRQIARTLASKGLPAWGYDCDVTRADHLAGLVRYVLETHGRIDTVCCNAGVAAARQQIAQQDRTTGLMAIQSQPY